MSSLKGLFYGVVSSSTFGLIPLFALPALRAGVGLDSVMFYRFALSALALGGWLLIRGKDFRVSLREMATLFVLGIFYGLTALLLTTSYLYIPSGVATTIHFLYPVVVTATMILFFKDKVSLPVIFATLTAIAGVYLLSSGEGGGNVSVRGIFLVLITVVTYALYIVSINKSEVQKMDGLKMTFYVLFSCTILFGLNLLVKGQWVDPIPNMNIGIHLVLLALIPTLISDFTLILSIQHIGSTTTAVLGCMEPLTAVVMGVLFLQEHFGIVQFSGMLMILFAMSVVILANNGFAFNFRRLVPLRIRYFSDKKWFKSNN